MPYVARSKDAKQKLQPVETPPARRPVSVAIPLRLDREHPFAQPIVGLVAVSVDEANALLEEWGHYLGPTTRPFPPTDAYALDVECEPVAVATSDGIVGDTSAGYARAEAVELSRLCTRPGEQWATRVMLRLWREKCGPKWPCVKPRAGEPPLAAVAYSKNDRHEGRIYRFDGWTRVTTTAGNSGGGHLVTQAPPQRRGERSEDALALGVPGGH